MPSSNQNIKGNRPVVNIKSKNKMQNKPSVHIGGKYKETEVKENYSRVDVCKARSITDLSSPGLCSTLQLANEIQASSARTSKVEELKDFQQKRLEEAIKLKAVKKTNVPFAKHIFKDLVDLYISDEEIPSAKAHPKNVNFSTNKDPVFCLQDFYKPDFSTQVRVEVPNPKFDIEKIDYYNGFEIYERLESLKKLAKKS